MFSCSDLCSFVRNLVIVEGRSSRRHGHSPDFPPTEFHESQPFRSNVPPLVKVRFSVGVGDLAEVIFVIFFENNSLESSIIYFFQLMSQRFYSPVLFICFYYFI